MWMHPSGAGPDHAGAEEQDAPDSERARVHEGPQVHVEAGPPQALCVWGDAFRGVLPETVRQLLSLRWLGSTRPPEQALEAQQTPNEQLEEGADAPELMLSGTHKGRGACSCPLSQSRCIRAEGSQIQHMWVHAVKEGRPGVFAAAVVHAHLPVQLQLARQPLPSFVRGQRLAPLITERLPGSTGLSACQACTARSARLADKGSAESDRIDMEGPAEMGGRVQRDPGITRRVTSVRR